jgi:O-methyltransferase
MSNINDLIINIKGKSEWLATERMRLVDSKLTLLEDCLSGHIYEDPPLKANGGKEFDANLREYGWDWPSVAHTMIGRKRLKNLRLLVENVLGQGVPGDLIETGVWRGGACIMMKGVLDAWKDTERTVWVADSFEGLPKPNAQKYPADAEDTFYTYPELSISIEKVTRNFQRYGLLDDKVQFLKGWFKDTLPTAPIESLAILRLDGDMYESTWDALVALYDKVSLNGYVIVDDYHVVEGCKKAVHDFLDERGIDVELQEIDGVGVYWKKRAAATADAASNEGVVPLNESATSVDSIQGLIDAFKLSESIEGELRAETAALHKSLAELQDLSKVFASELQLEKRKLTALESERAALKHALSEMKGSTSWKLTTPLRYFGSRMK